MSGQPRPQHYAHTLMLARQNIWHRLATADYRDRNDHNLRCEDPCTRSALTAGAAEFFRHARQTQAHPAITVTVVLPSATDCDCLRPSAIGTSSNQTIPRAEIQRASLRSRRVPFNALTRMHLKTARPSAPAVRSGLEPMKKCAAPSTTATACCDGSNAKTRHRPDRGRQASRAGRREASARLPLTAQSRRDRPPDRWDQVSHL